MGKRETVKLTVSIYRRPHSKPSWPSVTLPPELADCAGWQHTQLAWGFGDPGIVILCASGWEAAVSQFLAEHSRGESVGAAGMGNGAAAEKHRPGTPASASTARHKMVNTSGKR